METFSAQLAICAGNSPVPGEFPTQRPVTRSFDVFFDLRLNNDWVNNGEAGDLRRYRDHYDVIVMERRFQTTAIRSKAPNGCRQAQKGLQSENDVETGNIWEGVDSIILATSSMLNDHLNIKISSYNIRMAIAKKRQSYFNNETPYISKDSIYIEACGYRTENWSLFTILPIYIAAENL